MKRSKPHRLQDHVIKFPTLTSGLVCIMQPAFAANGSLKVTSFPTGAEVVVDGVPTNSGSGT
jgi:hypothetical protein